jgi:hypothetical protein
MVKFFLQNGKEVDEDHVCRAKIAYENAKRTGQIGIIKCSINIELADKISKMSNIEFAIYTNCYKIVKELS